MMFNWRLIKAEGILQIRSFSLLVFPLEFFPSYFHIVCIGAVVVVVGGNEVEP